MEDPDLAVDLVTQAASRRVASLQVASRQRSLECRSLRRPSKRPRMWLVCTRFMFDVSQAMTAASGMILECQGSLAGEAALHCMVVRLGTEAATGRGVRPSKTFLRNFLSLYVSLVSVSGVRFEA